MISEPPAGPMAQPGSEVPAARRWLAAAENLLLTFCLAVMVLLPLVEAVLRKFVPRGISGATAIEQHFTLIVALVGGAVAARDGRLLALGTLVTLLKGRWKTMAHVVSGAVAIAITLFLMGASIDFLLVEKESGTVLAYHIPLWAVELVLPIGYALIAWRLFRLSADRWRVRWVVLVALIFLVWMGGGFSWLAQKWHPSTEGFPWSSPIPSDRLLWPALGLLLVATVLGAPIFVTLGGAALILFWSRGDPVASVSLDQYTLVTNPTLPTIPLFTLAGYYLAEGGASKRLIRVFQALVGHFRGGPAIMTAFLCAFFTTFTGASGVTILALGGLLLPVLVAAHYSERHALGFLTGAGSLGLLFPPCLPIILYAIIARTSMERMYLGGLLPGLLLLGLVIWLAIWLGPKKEVTLTRFNGREAGAALWAAKWELLVPVVAVGALFSGLATPVEAAAVTALYAFVVETFFYRDLSLRRDVPRVMAECGLLIGGVLLILGVALGFTNYLIDAQVPTHMVDWVTRTIHARWLFLLTLNVFLLLVGCLMDIYSAIVVVVPLIVPLGRAFGIDPVHLGIIFLANLQLGYLTPPIGMNLFLASYRFGKPIGEVVRAVLPMLFVLLVGVLLITYVPWLTTFLPGLWGGKY